MQPAQDIVPPSVPVPGQEFPGVEELVFEGGVTLHYEPTKKLWFLAGPSPGQELHPSVLKEQHGLRRVMAIKRIPCAVGRQCKGLLLYSPDGTVPDYFQEMASARGFGWRGMDLSYLIGATMHHCAQLALRYGEAWKNEVAHRNTPGYRDQQDKKDQGCLQGVGEDAVHFEFEALVQTAQRAYEYARYPLRSRFELRAEPERKGSFLKTIKEIQSRNVPPPPQIGTWKSNFKELKKYRDCIAHNKSMSGGAPSMFFESVEDTFRLTAWLLENPESPGPHGPTPDPQSDFLSWGWERFTWRTIEDVKAILQVCRAES